MKNDKMAQMTGLGFIFVSIFALGGCARSNVSRSVASHINSAGVIGGKGVDSSLSFDDKILYLALGVNMTNTNNGSIHVSWNGHCTASAISPRIILTAAHCVVDRKPEELQIVLSKSPELTPLQLDQWYAAKAVRVHEKYTGSNGYFNDLALILLSKDLPPSRILKIANVDQIYLPMTLAVTGYGTSSESSDSAEQAKQTTGLNFVMKIVDNFDPAALTFKINQNDHKGFCSGDSGGPGLMYNSDLNDFTIVGVVSNVSMNDDKRKMLDPEGRFSLCIGDGNYTNVLNADLRHWIDQNQNKLEALN